MSSEQPKYVDVEGYLTVEPIFDKRSWSTDSEGRPILEGGRITSVTLKRPERLTRAGTFVTKVTLRVDARAFLPLLPKAVIHIGTSDVEIIEVDAHDPAYPPDPEQAPEGEQP